MEVEGEVGRCPAWTNVTIYFGNPVVSPDNHVVKAMVNGEIGMIDTPEQGNERPAGVLWCADNGKFSKTRAEKGIPWDEDQWWNFLVKNAPDADMCAFATAPDVVHWVPDESGKLVPVGDAEATLIESAKWYSKIRELGFKVALVAQDGLNVDDVPWEEIDAIFIGGSDDYKIGPQRLTMCGTPRGEVPSLEVVREAQRRNKWVHMGRVNSRMRYRFCVTHGIDSADGTFLLYGHTHSGQNLHTLRGWLAEAVERAEDELIAEINELVEGEER